PHTVVVAHFFEQVNGESDTYLAALQISQGTFAVFVRRLSRNSHSSNTMFAKHARHISRVIHAHAEPQSTYLRGGAEVIEEEREDAPRPDVIRRDEVRQALDIISAPTSERDLSKVQIISDAEVGKGGKAVLIDGIPEPKLGGDAIVEPVEDRKAVAPLRSRR